MKFLRHTLIRFFSIKLWGRLPGWLQRELSSLYAGIYNKPFSKHFIKPYCWVNYPNPGYLEKFRPASGSNSYKSFQDFFIRVFREPLEIQSEAVWACEGNLCDYGRVDELPEVSVKCQTRNLRSIFGKAGDAIPSDHFFSNVFLHNNILMG